MVAWPGVYRLVAEYESLAYANVIINIINKQSASREFFFEKLLKLYSIMKEMGIPSRKRQMTY